MKDERPIGIFDSGVGGLTVLKVFRDRYPGENFIYFGDTARVPYGTKSEKTVVRYSMENSKFLEKFDVKLIVVACNTSSSIALDVLKREFNVPVIGVVKPGSLAAVKVTKTGNVGVIGTEATVKSGSYRKEILLRAPLLNVYEKPCPLFVPLIEEGWIEDEITMLVAKRYLSYFKDGKVDTLVLGCTHYPLLKSVIGKILEGVTLVDSAEETVKETAKVLKGNLDEVGIGKVRVFVSDLNERFEKIAEMILENRISIKEVSTE